MTRDNGAPDREALAAAIREAGIQESGRPHIVERIVDAILPLVVAYGDERVAEYAEKNVPPSNAYAHGSVVGRREALAEARAKIAAKVAANSAYEKKISTAWVLAALGGDDA